MTACSSASTAEASSIVHAWGNLPSYIAEEWNAYVNDALVAAEDKRADGQIDCAMGTLELGVYSVAMAMAVEKYDPESWKDESSLKLFMQSEWKRAKAAFDECAPIFPYRNQDKMLDHLRTSSDAEAMRAFIRKHLDGVWLSP